jgi:4-amino-4-deoxy-L-arabinose transferase-like glycosyltransferase
MHIRIFQRSPTIVWVVALTLIALGLRLSLLPTRLLVENDGPYYVALAAQILRGNWSGALNDYWSQLYPLAIAGLGVFTRDPELAARLVSALCGAALVPALWWLVSDMADPLSALLATALVVFQPWLLVFSTLALTEMLFALCMVTALALILRAGRLGGFRRFVLAGAATGLAILTRPEGALLVAVLLGVGLLRLTRQPSWQGMRDSAGACAVSLLTLVLVMAPQSIGTYQLYGHLNLAWKSSVNVALGDAFADPSQAERAAYSLDDHGQRKLATQARQASLGRYWLRQTGDALRRIGENARRAWQEGMTAVVSPVPWLSTPLALALGALPLLGVIGGLRGAKRGATLAVAACAAAYSAGLLSVLVHHRLLVPLAPIVLCFIAMGLSRLVRGVQRAVERIKVPPWRRVAGGAVLLVGVAALLCAAVAGYTWAYTRSDPFSREPVAQREAGQWLRANVPQTVNVLSHNPQTPLYFYTDWPFDRALSLPWATPDKVLAFARDRGARYIILEEWMIRAAHFPVEPWLDFTQPHPGLTLLNVLGTAPERVIIYRRDD